MKPRQRRAPIPIARERRRDRIHDFARLVRAYLRRHERRPTRKDPR